ADLPDPAADTQRQAVLQVTQCGLKGDVRIHRVGVTAVAVLEQRSQLDRQPVPGLPQRCNMPAPHIHLVDVLPSLNRVIDEPWILTLESAETDAELVGDQGQTHRATGPITLAAVLYAIEVDLRARADSIQRGIGSDELHQSAETRGAIQCSLRASQDFDTLQVGRIEVRDQDAAVPVC